MPLSPIKISLEKTLREKVEIAAFYESVLALSIVVMRQVDNIKRTATHAEQGLKFFKE